MVFILILEDNNKNKFGFENCFQSKTTDHLVRGIGFSHGL
jgi:hypothetical protein